MHGINGLKSTLRKVGALFLLDGNLFVCHLFKTEE